MATEVVDEVGSILEGAQEQSKRRFPARWVVGEEYFAPLLGRRIEGTSMRFLSKIPRVLL